MSHFSFISFSSLVLISNFALAQELPSSRDCLDRKERLSNISTIKQEITKKTPKFDIFHNYSIPSERPKELPKETTQTNNTPNKPSKPVAPLREISDKEYLSQITINVINMREKTMTVGEQVYRIGDTITLEIEKRPRTFKLIHLINGDRVQFSVEGTDRKVSKSIGWEPF